MNLSPQEIAKNAKDNAINGIPPDVLKAIAGLIASKLRSRPVSADALLLATKVSADFSITEAVDAILDHCGNKYSRDELFEKKYLDFEEAFRNQGWTVEFEKAAYNESSPSMYYFSAVNKEQ